MLRHRRSRVLIVLGADDGLLPAFSDPSGLLADPERQKLRSLGVDLSPGRETAVDREMSWVCAALSAAEDRVCLVTTAAQPSFLYTRTQSIFPALQVLRAEDEVFLPDCAAAAGAALRQPSLPPWLPDAVRAEAESLSARSSYHFADMAPAAVEGGDPILTIRDKLQSALHTIDAGFLFITRGITIEDITDTAAGRADTFNLKSSINFLGHRRQTEVLSTDRDREQLLHTIC